MNKKSKWLFAARVAAFVTLLAIMVSYLNYVLLYKNNLYLIEKQPDGVYDVILAGPSHMELALQPAQLFGEYGIASCNTATSAQSLPSTYHLLKEMIDRHDPELVVLDLFCLFYPEIATAPARIHEAMDAFPLSKNKIEAVKDLVQENRIEYYLPFLLYHSRWDKLEKNDYRLHADGNETYNVFHGIEAFPEPFTPLPLEDKAEIPEIPLTYLEKIIDLCQQTDTELLLIVIPYRADVDNNDTSAVFQQQLYNTAAELAEARNVDFLNGLHYLEEMDFDFTTDMVEYSHVNAFGAQKSSRFFGQYIVDHYDVPNRMEDAAYAHWHQDYAAYLEEIETETSKDSQ